MAIVARWYPSVHDPVAGRFIADQVHGISQSDRVATTVITFEPAPLNGSPEERRQQYASVQAVAAAGRSAVDPVNASGWNSPEGVPVARLTIPSGWIDARNEPDHEAADRIPALLDMAPVLSRQLPARSLVHAHTAYPDGNAAAHLASRLRLPLVVTEHSTFLPDQLADPPRRAGVVAALRAAARIVAVSETFAAEIREALPEVGPKLRVIPNAVATDDFRLVEPRRRRDGEIVFVGYLKPTKGIDLLIDAFARVHAARADARLRLVGSATPVDGERWSKHVEQLRLGDAVCFDGPADRAGVVEAMSRAALMVHAGYRETFGVVAVEALATGLPIVATDSGGITEILGDEPDHYGRLVRSREPDELAAAILDVLDHRERFDPHVLRSAVEDRYSLHAVASRIIDLYEEVLDEAPHRGRSPAGWLRRAARPAVPSTASDGAVVVAFNEERALETLAPLPRHTLTRLTVVIRTPGLEADLLARGVGNVTVVDPEATYRAMLARVGAVGPRRALLRRLAGLITDPLGPWRRRRVRSQRSRLPEAAEEMTVVEAVHGMRTKRGRPLVVGLEAADLAAVEPLVGNRAIRFAPGGVRWLADRDAAAVSAYERRAHGTR